MQTPGTSLPPAIIGRNWLRPISFLKSFIHFSLAFFKLFADIPLHSKYSFRRCVFLFRKLIILFVAFRVLFLPPSQSLHAFFRIKGQNFNASADRLAYEFCHSATHLSGCHWWRWQACLPWPSDQFMAQRCSDPNSHKRSYHTGMPKSDRVRQDLLPDRPGLKYVCLLQF